VADMHQLLKARQRSIREIEGEKKREEKLRREEHRRNQRLQKRLEKATVQLRRSRNQLQRVRNSRTWRYTAPLRSFAGRLRRAGRTLRGHR
jgi:hypothetical protein